MMDSMPGKAIMSDTLSTERAGASLLTLPRELRLLIYTHLFMTTTNTVKVEPPIPNDLDYDINQNSSSDTTPSENDSWRMSLHPKGLSSQLLRTSHQICSEALPLLYSTNAFDCSCRDGVRLLLSSIGPGNFTHLTSLILDWDQLLDFSFQLAKPSFVALTSNLSCLTMTHWRTRVLGGSSFLWRDVKSYERTLVQSALAICEKSAKLRIVGQHHWVGRHGQTYAQPRRRTGSVGTATAPNLNTRLQSGSVNQGQQEGQGPIGKRNTQQASSTSRIKWRFLASESQLWEKETRVDLESELALLSAKGKDEEEGSVQSALDPF